MGQDLAVTEQDLRDAERGGRIARRSPVQLSHKEAAAVHTAALDAKVRPSPRGRGHDGNN